MTKTTRRHMSSLAGLAVERESRPPSRPKVLVVDDDVFTVRLIARTLEADAKVIVAHNGRDGLSVALAERPDLIILDYVMPDLLGDDVCRLMRAHDELDGVKIVFLTAHGRFLSEHGARAAGADALLVKPFSPIALIDLVAQLLAASHRAG